MQDHDSTLTTNTSTKLLNDGPG